MAQALRTVWLEPEEQQENLAPQLRPRRPQRPALARRQSLVVAMGMVCMVAVAVGLLIAYINSYARIARYDFQRQSLATELRQLTDDYARLKLDVARLENTPRIAEVAKSQQLEFPSADRVHYVRDAHGFPQSAVAQSTPAPRQHSWFVHAEQSMAAALDTAVQRLSRGPGTPAYAQE